MCLILGFVTESIVSNDGDEQAFTQLVDMVNATFRCDVRRRCEAKVRGVVDLLYDSGSGWLGTPAVHEILIDEWRGARNMSAPGCDLRDKRYQCRGQWQLGCAAPPTLFARGGVP